jgi:tetratricopeptide (TPR) repeat protein
MVFKKKRNMYVVILANKTIPNEDIALTIQHLPSKIRECKVIWREEDLEERYEVLLYPGERLLRIVEEDDDSKAPEGSSSGLCQSLLQHKDFLKRKAVRGSRRCIIEMSKHTPGFLDVDILLQGNIHSLETGFLDRHPRAFEGYYKLALLYLKQNDHHKSYKYLQMASSFRHDIDTDLGWVEDWHGIQFNVNCSIVSYYVGQIQEGKNHLDRILFSEHSSYYQNAYTNYEYYAQPLEVLWTKKYPCSDYKDRLPSSVQDYTSLNPSLLPYREDMFFLNLRIVNWKVNPVGFNQYTSPHPKGKFKTKNMLGIVNSKGEWHQSPVLIEKASDLDLKKVRKHHIDGFEDCRLFHWDEASHQIHFITNYSKNNRIAATRLSIGTIDITTLDQPQYTSLDSLYGYGEDQTQKNWLIYNTYTSEHGDLIQDAVYAYEPFQRIQIKEHKVRVLEEKDTSPLKFGKWRGSGGPVPFGDGYLMIVHEVYLKHHRGRRYLHRFVYLDKDFTPRKCSGLWYLESQDIEYVSTLQKIPQEETYLIGYGLCDACACLSAVTKISIEKQLLPLDTFLL